MNKKLIIIIIAVVLVLAIAAGAYFLFFRSSEPKIVRTEYSPGEYFVIDIGKTGRLLKVTVVLVLDTDKAKVQEHLTAYNSEIRDLIGTIFREQDEDTLRQTDHTELKEDIRQRLNALLEIENIIGVLFPDYAIQ